MSLIVVEALALLGRAMFVDDVGTADRLLSIAAGVLLLFVGVAMLSSRLVRPLAALVGLPARREAGGAAGRLASGNAVRNPSRTAATAAALMIGIALVSFVATLDGMKASNRAIEEQVVADYVVARRPTGARRSRRRSGITLSESSTPEVVTHVRSGVAEVNGDDSEVSGIEPEKILSAYVFDWTKGVATRCSTSSIARARSSPPTMHGGPDLRTGQGGESPVGIESHREGPGSRCLQAAAVLSPARQRHRLRGSSTRSTTARSIAGPGQT